jgi:hypothetical protein
MSGASFTSHDIRNLQTKVCESFCPIQKKKVHSLFSKNESPILPNQREKIPLKRKTRIKSHEEEICDFSKCALKELFAKVRAALQAACQILGITGYRKRRCFS